MRIIEDLIPTDSLELSHHEQLLNWWGKKNRQRIFIKLDPANSIFCALCHLFVTMFYVPKWNKLDTVKLVTKLYTIFLAKVLLSYIENYVEVPELLKVAQ